MNSPRSRVTPKQATPAFKRSFSPKTRILVTIRRKMIPRSGKKAFTKVPRLTSAKGVDSDVP
jgi:hypothetical protein